MRVVTLRSIASSLFVIALALAGCDSDSAGSGAPAGGDSAPGADAGGGDPGAEADPGSQGDPDAEAQPDGEPTPDAGPEPDPEPVPQTFDGNPANGLWRVTVAIVEIGGIELPFQVDMTSSGSLEGGDLAADWSLRAVDAGDDSITSDVMGTATGTPINADGEFEADFGSVVLPGPYSPSGTPIPLSLTLKGQFKANDFACGSVNGFVVGLNITLAASTFGAVPWDSGLAAPSDCTPPGAAEDLPRLTAEQCPALTAGTVSGFESGGEVREFQLILPEGHDPAASYPLIFAYHGLGGSSTWIYAPSISGLVSGASARGYILVSPQGRGLPAIEYDQASTADSPDLAMFDDIITCAQAQLGADPNRIHVTGMSGGGLFTAYLTRMRPEVIASSAPMSGGLIVGYAEPSGRKPPVLVGWGGATDFAVAQNFDTFAKDLIDDLAGGGHFLATCNHGQGHSWPAEMTTPILDWLFAHPLDVADLPFADGLPDSFPDYCKLH